MLAQSDAFFGNESIYTEKPKTHFSIHLAGDCQVGKTTLINKYWKQKFSDAYKPTKQNREVAGGDKVIDGDSIKLQLINRDGSNKTDDFSEGHAFMVLASTDSVKSY